MKQGNKEVMEKLSKYRKVLQYFINNNLVKKKKRMEKIRNNLYKNNKYKKNKLQFL